VLFTDIVYSTNRAVALGDRRWRSLLDEHDALAQQMVERHRGRLVKSTGDGILATFDGPGRAVRCALALSSAAGERGVPVRAGLHTGEIEMRGSDVGGVAVHAAARVMSASNPGEVLVSRVVTDIWWRARDYGSPSAALTTSRACRAAGTCSRLPCRPHRSHHQCRIQVPSTRTPWPCSVMRWSSSRILVTPPMRCSSRPECSASVPSL
jgi:class 3 adenylate cyclase